jgi:hypothetical protein
VSGPGGHLNGRHRRDGAVGTVRGAAAIIESVDSLGPGEREAIVMILRGRCDARSGLLVEALQDAMDELDLVLSLLRAGRRQGRREDSSERKSL